MLKGGKESVHLFKIYFILPNTYKSIILKLKYYTVVVFFRLLPVLV